MSNCIHLREPTGERVLCPTCNGHVELKVFACALHGTCTIGKPAPGVAKCCLTCPDNTTERKAPTLSTRQKLALITLNIGNVLQPKSRASMQDAARRWGADFREITAPIRPVGGRPHWQKAFLAAWAAQQGYDRCIYYDADILIRSDCPSVFDLTPAGHLGIVSNDQFDGVLWKPGAHNRYWPSLESWAKRLNKKCPPLHEHANSGMIVFEPTAHRKLFDIWGMAGYLAKFGAPTKLIDQAAFSVLVHNLCSDETRTWLPMMFNTLIYRHELLRANGPMQSFVYHYTGHRKGKLNETEWRVGARQSPSKPIVPPTLPKGNLVRTPAPTTLGPQANPRDLAQRAVCINLDRRPDRWAEFQNGLPQPWPFAPITRLPAIDVQRCPPPEWFAHEAGQWGCRQSHLRVLEDALNDNVGSLMVFEDDALFCANFLARVREFLAAVPTDWELLFLGGCHTRGFRRPLGPIVEIPGYVTLAHAYIVRGSAMRLLYEHACRHTPQRAEFDHRLGDFAESYGCPVYAPRDWLVYQAAGFSDLRLKHRPLRGLTPSDATI